MRKAILVDKTSSVVYNLTELISEDHDRELTIGRNEKNVIQLGAHYKNHRDTKNMWVHGSPIMSVSGEHAKIILKKWGKGHIEFLLRDYSSNGTKVNGAEIEKYLLNHGDNLFFGGYGPVVYEEPSENSDYED